MPSQPSTPKTLACVPCWRDAFADGELDTAAPSDSRRFVVGIGDNLVVHRRKYLDTHVVGAVCGEIYTQHALLDLSQGA